MDPRPGTVRAMDDPAVEDAGEVVRRAPFGENSSVGERGASTQRRLLRAALEVFSEHGYHDTRVELITEAAGCSRPAFYQYFSRKEDVFWRLAGHLANDMGELAESIHPVTPDAAGVAHLCDWLDAFTDLCAEYEPILSSYPAAARERRPDAEDTRGIGNRVGTAIFRWADRDHPALDQPALTNITVGIVMRSIYYWQVGLGQLDRSRFIDGLAQTIHRLLHGAVEGVNIAPVSHPPARRAPRWPALPERVGDDALRPRGRQTRRRLLDAGAAVLPVRGYHGTRVDDVVAEAGVSHGSFYRYFANKDDLFRVLAHEAAAAMVELVAGFPEGGEPGALRRWLDEWFLTYRDNGGVISAWQEIDADGDELTNFSLDVALVTFDRLSRIVSQRGFGDATVDAVVLLAVIERAPYNVLALGHIHQEEAVEASAVLIRRGLFGAEPT